jgi:hypothetical protein
MASTTERIIIDVDSEELQRLIQLLGDAGSEFTQVENAASNVDLSQFNDGLRSVNNNVATIKNLNIAETVKSIGGTFNEVSSKLKFFEQALKDVGESAENPFAQNLALAGSAAVGYSGFALEAAGTTLELGGALAQIAAVLPPITGLTASLGAAWAAISGAFVAAKTALVAFLTTMTLSTGIIGAFVITAAFVVNRLMAIRAENKALEEAYADLAAQTDRNRQSLNEYYSTFTQFTDQYIRLQEARESADASIEQANTYLARSIALQRDSLGLYSEEESLLSGRVETSQLRMRYMEQESVQLDIQNMLLAGISEAEIARVTQMKFQAWYTGQTANELERWLDTAPQINQELLVTSEQMGNINAQISDFAGGLVGWFQRLGATSEENVERVSRSVSRVRTDIEALIRTRNSLEDSLDARLARVLEDDSLELRISRQNLYIQSTAEQQALLLQIWEREDIAADERVQAEEERIRQRLQAEQEAQRQRDEIRQRDVQSIEASLAETQAYLERELALFDEANQNKMNLVFGGGEFEELSGKMQTSLMNMSEEGASALGVLNGSMTDMASGFASSLGSALMSGERVDKALQKALGGMLSSLGQTYLAQGAALLIPPPFNPLGNPAAGATMMTLGGSMLGLAAAFGAVGGGSKTSKKSPSTPKANEAGKSSNVSVMNNFGFVSDRRAVARDVADTTRTAVRRGQ